MREEGPTNLCWIRRRNNLSRLKRKIIIISRNYPPKIGGLESYSYNLIKEFEKHHHVIKIVLSKSIRHLIWFAPYSFIKSLNLAGSHSIRHIHLCDAVLAPIGLLLKLSLDVQVSVSVHGLDITYGHILYKSLIPGVLPGLIGLSVLVRRPAVSANAEIFRSKTVPLYRTEFGQMSTIWQKPAMICVWSLKR